MSGQSGQFIEDCLNGVWREDPRPRYVVVHNEVVDTLQEVEAAQNRHARRAVIARRRAARKAKA